MENNPYPDFNANPANGVQTPEPMQGNIPDYTPPYNAPYTPGTQTPGSYTAPSYTPQGGAPYNSGNGAYNPSANQSPSAIYHNTPPSPTPQYHYGNPAYSVNFNNEYYQEQRRKFAERKKAEHDIHHIGNVSGAILIACLAIASVFSLVLVATPIYNYFESSVSVSSFINMIYSLVVVGGTFGILGNLYKTKKKTLPTPYPGEFPDSAPKARKLPIQFGAPKNKLQALLLIIISFGGCMFANYISSILIAFLGVFGAESTYNSIQDPKSTADLLLMCLSVAVIPPLIEEYALRGVALSNLRRYGNSFAIIASAIMFGIFHGDAMQIPFAFICGLFFAYAVIATESLWTGIIIHALNNILSCISSVIMQVGTEDAANTFFSVVSIGGMVLAVVCVFIYYALFRKDGVTDFKGEAAILTTSQKIGKFLTSPVMIIALILYGIQALGTLNFS